MQDGKDWERPIHVEWFETAGDSVLAQNVGVRIQGSSSPALPQKSLRLYAKNDYGPSGSAPPSSPTRPCATSSASCCAPPVRTCCSPRSVTAPCKGCSRRPPSPPRPAVPPSCSSMASTGVCTRCASATTSISSAPTTRWTRTRWWSSTRTGSSRWACPRTSSPICNCSRTRAPGTSRIPRGSPPSRRGWTWTTSSTTSASSSTSATPTGP